MAGAAEALSVSIDIIKRAIAQGLIRSTKVGKLRRIPAAEVERVAEQGLPKISYPARAPRPQAGPRRGRPRKVAPGRARRHD